MKPLLIKPQGRLDASRARPLEAELKQHLANGQIHFLIDLSETRYISSNGLRVLLAAHKQASKSGGALKLCGLDTRLKEIFEMAGFDRVFEILSTREQADSSF
jgi:anti-anti-sigma factor